MITEGYLGLRNQKTSQVRKTKHKERRMRHLWLFVVFFLFRGSNQAFTEVGAASNECVADNSRARFIGTSSTAVVACGGNGGPVIHNQANMATNAGYDKSLDYLSSTQNKAVSETEDTDMVSMTFASPADKENKLIIIKISDGSFQKQMNI